MSIEKALITQASPGIAISKLREKIKTEVAKGCTPDIFPHPIDLEPEFYPLWKLRDDINNRYREHRDEVVSVRPDDFIKLLVWISPDQKFDWIQSELFLKQIKTIGHRSIFEVCGNKERIVMSIKAHENDVPIIMSAFKSQFDLCELTPSQTGSWHPIFNRGNAVSGFRDFFPPAPYSHLLTRPQELKNSPLSALISVISSIEPPANGLVQTIFQPVQPTNNWHRNVEILLGFAVCSYTNWCKRPPVGSFKNE